MKDILLYPAQGTRSVNKNFSSSGELKKFNRKRKRDITRDEKGLEPMKGKEIAGYHLPKDGKERYVRLAAGHIAETKKERLPSAVPKN